MLSIIILAAGLGKRMQTPDIPKVLAKLKGSPLIYYVLNTANKLNPNKIVLVVGHHKEMLIDYVTNQFNSNKIKFAVQQNQLGTGHAVLCAEKELLDSEDNILILSGDVPLLTETTLNKFIDNHNSLKADISVLSAAIDNPTGYGRIVRDKNGKFIAITEEKDATDEIKKIKEINGGVYCINAKLLFELLKKINNNNMQNEYYLTDIIDLAYKQNLKVIASNIANFKEIQGINTREQLINIENNL